MSSTATHLRSEGDVNNTPARQEWNNKIQDEATQTLLERDADVFLHQSMSTPCLDSLEAAEGSTFRTRVASVIWIFMVITCIS
ncbi:4-aminobutyrate aminotransferase [Vibrio maritimus]|uniref:4-aminobutyrate aminotransferase n=1 Tax=Vibrio maritimus TaxID=990268 RepID=A0A090RT02_9VIBR|nr:4-aminobutyrate aminotransferase [Vibrio maritimus]